MTKSSFNGIYIEYESKGDKNKNQSTKEYIIMIRPYLSDVIIDCKTQGEWKTQLTMSINFFLLQILLKLVVCAQKVIMGLFFYYFCVGRKI